MAATDARAEPGSISAMSFAERRDLSIYLLMRSLPVPLVSRIGASLGQILGRRAHPAADARVAAALRQLCPDVARDPAALEAARVRLWSNVGRIYAEFCVLQKIVPVGRASVDDLATLDAVLADGRPVIVTFVHLGNWETSAIQIFDRAPGRAGALAAPPPANRVRAHIAALQRGRLPGTVFTTGGNVWRHALQHLETPGGVLMAAVDEQVAGRVSIPSFGRALDTSSNAGKLIRMAILKRAIILPLYSERLAGARFVTHVLPPLEFPWKLKLGTKEQLQYMAQLDALYAPAVLRLIDQWFGLLEYSG